MSDADATGTDAETGVSLVDRLPSIGIDPREMEAVIAGGLAGGFQAALVLQLHDTDAIKEIGLVADAPTLNGGWLTMFGLGILFALPFGVFVSRTIDSFTSKVMMLSSRNDVLRKILVPLLKRSALTTTTLGLGTGYGVVVGVLFSLLLLPIWVTAVMGGSMPIPNLTGDGLFGIVAWGLYGGTLGLVYGLILEG